MDSDYSQYDSNTKLNHGRYSKLRSSMKRDGSQARAQEILISDHEMSHIEEINSSGLMSQGSVIGQRKRSLVGKYPSRMTNQTHLAPLSNNDASSDNNEDADYIPVNGRQYNLDSKKMIFKTAKPQSGTPGGVQPHAVVVGEERYKSLEEAR